MRTDIKVPPAGDSIAEGDIARWFKATGDLVKRDDVLVELETDKASMEIVAPAAGRLHIDSAVGSTVKVGQVIGYIEAVEAGAAPAKPATPTASGIIPTADDDDEDEEDRAKHSTLYNFAMPSPSARKLMSENNVSAKDIVGSGRGRRITKADVLKYVENLKKEEAIASRPAVLAAAAPTPPAPAPAEVAPAAPPPPTVPGLTAADATPAVTPAPAAAPKPAPMAAPALPPPAPGARRTRVEKLSRMRRTIAERLVNAQHTAALLTTFNEVDMGAIMDLRKRYKDEFKERYQVGLGFMSFFTKAACQALLAFPMVNASIEGENGVYHDYCDIGIAVATPRGLVVPVVRNAEALSLRQIEAAIAALAVKGRDGTLTPDELSGGTFSITNGGIFGSMLSTPIVNYPQSAILGMHNIVERPVAKDGQVVIRPIMYVALTYDHRLIDGADAVRFLVKVKSQLEDPARMLLEL